VRYIGAGAVAAAGIITLVRSLPVMIESFRIGFGRVDARRATSARRPAPVGGAPAPAPLRTGRDLPLKLVGFGMLLVIALVLTFVPAPFGRLRTAAPPGGGGLRGRVRLLSSSPSPRASSAWWASPATRPAA
jgi:hypothetical protein